MLKWFKKINSKDEKGNDFNEIVSQINNLESEYEKFTNEQISNKTIEFKDRLSREETLDDILVEAFALVREASKRTLNLRHYDVQLIGGIALHRGSIAEMKTGEGKTLTATLPAYLNALSGKVHILTVNSYLAIRDVKDLKPLYSLLGLTVAPIVEESTFGDKLAAYSADIIYGKESEVAFDYLRDNIALTEEDLVQKGLDYVIIDEADSILIDGARNPLILSGLATKSDNTYYDFTKIADQLSEDHIVVNERERVVHLSDDGIEKVEELLEIENLYDVEQTNNLRKIENALYTKIFMKKDIDYIVKNNEIVVIDTISGRPMEGSRFQDGQHQSVQARENLEITPETEIRGVITYQNFFRLYKKCSGMTGTAVQSENEFSEVYNLPVHVVPPNKEISRIDLPDVIFKTKEIKNNAIVEKIIEINKTGQPILIGTTSIKDSEILSSKLREKNISHTVLNAKNHFNESEIIKNAGQLSSITISTNMAGRGTDIIVPKESLEKGGLFVLGTSRHENRRIDDQLRGRTGRQGDIGCSQFVISLEDELLQRFGGEKISKTLDKLKIPEDMPIEHDFVSKLVNQIQNACEDSNFKIRKYVLLFDDIINSQRTVISNQRKDILIMTKEEVRKSFFEISDNIATNITIENCPKEIYPEEWNLVKIEKEMNEFLFPEDAISKEHFKIELEGEYEENIKSISEVFKRKIIEVYERKESAILNGEFPNYVRGIIVATVDEVWKTHLSHLEYLKRSTVMSCKIAKKDPLTEYSFIANDLFEETLEILQEEITKNILKLELYIN